MDYYKQVQYIAEVNKQDAVIQKVEKWEAHQQGILHRAFTVILKYDDRYILQHRKHPVFDGCFDLTFSSHQIYENDKLQDDLTAIYSSLKREWNLMISDLVKKPKKAGEVYYKEKDPQSGFYDHEIDYIYEAELKKIPSPNYDFAYGFSLVKKEDLSKNFKINFAPWVKKIIQKKVINL